MADDNKKKPDAAPPAKEKPSADKDAAKPAKGSPLAMLTKTPVLLTGVMVLEAAVLLAGFRFLGGGAQPASAEVILVEEDPHAAPADGHAAEPADAKADSHAAPSGAAKGPVDKKKPVELPVLEFRAPNKRSGRTFLYDVSLYLRTRGEHADKARQMLTDNEALIKDRVRTIIAQSDPEKLAGGSEPGLETLRRQIKYQLDELLGEGVVDEVLIPRCIPYRADF